MKITAKLLKRIAAMAVAGVCAVTAASCGSSLSPMQTIEEAAEKNTERLEKCQASTVAALEKISKGGSIELQVSLPDFLDTSVKLFTDLDSASPASAITVNAGLHGANLLDFMMKGSSDSLVVVSEALLGDGAYGIALDKIPENFPNSVFGPDGELALGDDFYDILETMASSYALNLESYEAMEDSLGAFIDDVKPEIYTAIETNGEAKIADGSVSLRDNEIKTTDVTIDFSAAELVATVKDILTTVKESEELKPLIESRYDYSITYAAIYSEYYTADELYDEFLSVINDSIAELEAVDVENEDLSDVLFSISAHIAKKTGELLSIGLDMSSPENENIKYEIHFPTSLSEDFKFSFDVNDNDENNHFDVSYTVKENSKENFHAQITANVNDKAIDIANIEWNKASGEFLAQAYDFVDSSNYGGVLFSIAGTCTTDKNAATFTVTDITVAGESITTKIALILTYSDKMPVVEEFTDVLTMTMEEVEALANRIYYAVGSLIG